MTALEKYQRIEASGLWRPSRGAQRVDVIVSIGDATLVIADRQDRALAHWSLPAVERSNPGKTPAIYHPDGDPGETLELASDEVEMVAAIEKLRQAIERRRPHPGRLRFWIVAAFCVSVALVALFWLPGALRSHAASVVPPVKRAEIGEALFAQIQRVTGPACRRPEGRAVLEQLAGRFPGLHGAGQLHVVRDGVATTTHLPGGTILINRALVEDFDDPDVVAGFIVAERLRAGQRDVLHDVLDALPVWASFRLLTTGGIPDHNLARYAEAHLKMPQEPLSDDILLAGFEAASLRATPYAYALDITGEKTLSLIEADPFIAAPPEQIMSDANWLRLQSICGG